MIYTSYYGNQRNFIKGIAKVSTSLYPPKYCAVDKHAIELTPTKGILFDYKYGRINEEQYTKRYYEEVLSKLDPKDIAQKYSNSILLCYEKKGDPMT